MGLIGDLGNRITRAGKDVNTDLKDGSIKPRVAPAMTFSQFDQAATQATTYDSKATSLDTQAKDLESKIKSYTAGGATSATQYQSWQTDEKKDLAVAHSDTTDATKIEDRLTGYSVKGPATNVTVKDENAIYGVQRHDLTTANEDRAEATALQDYQNGKGMSSLNGLNTTERNAVTSIEDKAAKKADGNFFTTKGQDIEHSYLKSEVSSLDTTAKHDDSQSFGLGRSVGNYEVKSDDTEIKHNAAELKSDYADLGSGKINTTQFYDDKTKLVHENNEAKDQVAGIRDQEKSWAYSTANTANINKPSKADDKSAASYYSTEADKNLANYYGQASKNEASVVSRDETELKNGKITVFEKQKLNEAIKTGQSTETEYTDKTKAYTAAATKSATTEPAFLKSSSYKTPAIVRHLEVTAGDTSVSDDVTKKPKVEAGGVDTRSSVDPAAKYGGTDTSRGTHSTSVHGHSKPDTVYTSRV